MGFKTSSLKKRETKGFTAIHLCSVQTDPASRARDKARILMTRCVSDSRFLMATQWSDHKALKPVDTRVSAVQHRHRHFFLATTMLMTSRFRPRFRDSGTSLLILF
jgi:hypothetical protein